MYSKPEAFSAHPFAFLWSREGPRSAEEAADAISLVERRAADLIYQNEQDPAPVGTLQYLFMPYHLNGTFAIGVRNARSVPPFLRGESGTFSIWAKTVARSDLVRMLYARVLPSTFQPDSIDRVASIIGDSLLYRGSAGRLCDQIPNQNYIDYVRRAIGLYVYHDADFEFDTEGDYTEFATEIAFALIQHYQQEQPWQEPSLVMLRQLMVYSLLAGVIALDMKCSHCAASSLTSDYAAASQGENAQERVVGIQRWLRGKASDSRLFCDELFAWDIYRDAVLRQPCKLYFFPDDLGETVIDLFRLQVEMIFNPQLQVTFVPRNGRFHNDCALDDVAELMNRDCLEILRRFTDEGRFLVNPHGPRNGAIERPKMNRKLVEAILADADVLFFKGSRSYEMTATGMRIPTFSGQTVSREFSESITGASSAVGVPVLRFFHAFPDYWGFTERHCRIEPLFPTGLLGWQANMTAIDSARFTSSPEFRSACTMRTIPEVADEIMSRAADQRVPPHRVKR